ncbi:MAG: hypothetical protein ABSF15_08605 [Candidatus Sulfotelmatobacter sp.]|jgi:hypothetical protein
MVTKISPLGYLSPPPLFHLAACAVIAFANIKSGVHFMIYVDFPFSWVLVVLGWRNDNFPF